MNAFALPEDTGSPSSGGAGALSGLTASASGTAEAFYIGQTPEMPAARHRWSMAVLDSTPDYHCVLDPDGRFCYVNSAFSALLQQPAAYLVGKNFSEAGYLPELAALLQRQVAQAVRSGHQARHEVQSVAASGVALHHEYIFTPIFADDDTVEVVAGTVRDISAHRNAEQLWRQAQEQFASQLRQHTAELTEANRLLQAEIGERRLAEQLLLESQQLLRHLAAYQERVKEDECKRIAREIHDELGQNLLALRIDVLRLQVRTANRHPALNQRVGSALAQIDRTIKSVRSIVNNLRPPVLDLGLHAAIEWQVREFRRRNSIACELSGDGKDFDAALDEQRALAIFRVLQESLANIVRHAHASRVSIELRRDAGILFMKIGDNGVGMDVHRARKANSFGLVGIRERISYLQGELTIDSTPGHGTTLTVSIPLFGAG